MSVELNGVVALVTGASSGIGEATARKLSASGAAVALIARRKERLDLIAAQMTASGGRALPIDADIAGSGRASAAVERVISEYGRLDVVVNCAGALLSGSIVDTPPDDWERMLDVNVRGLLAVCHAALPHLLNAARTEPRYVADIVNVSSVAGRTVRSDIAIYSMTKWGVGVYSEALRQEVTSRYVRIAVIEPGATAPSELANDLPPDAADQMHQRLDGITPLTADNVAEAIAFVVTRERGVAINEILMRPTSQTF